MGRPRCCLALTALLASSCGAAGGPTADDDGDRLPNALDPCSTVKNPQLFDERFDGTLPFWDTHGGRWHIGPTNLFEEAVIEDGEAFALAPGLSVDDAFVEAPLRATDMGEGPWRVSLWLRAVAGAADEVASAYGCEVEFDGDGTALVLTRRRAAVRDQLGRSDLSAAIVPGLWYTVRLYAKGGDLRCVLRDIATVNAVDPTPLPPGSVAIAYQNVRGECQTVAAWAMPAACAVP